MHTFSWCRAERERGAGENIKGGRINRFISWCLQRFISPWTCNPWSACVFIHVCVWVRWRGEGWSRSGYSYPGAKLRKREYCKNTTSVPPHLPDPHLYTESDGGGERWGDVDLFHHCFWFLTFLPAQHVEVKPETETSRKVRRKKKESAEEEEEVLRWETLTEQLASVRLPSSFLFLSTFLSPSCSPSLLPDVLITLEFLVFFWFVFFSQQRSEGRCAVAAAGMNRHIHI